MGITVHRLASHTHNLNRAVLTKMKAFVAVVAALCASAKAQYPFYAPYSAGYGYGYAGLPLAAPAYAPAAVAPAAVAPATVASYAAAAPVIAPAVPAPAVSSQFQTQDEFKNTAYGYSNINAAKHEVGNAYGGVTGSYSYVDANGVLQTTNYIADGLGFRVVASNLPVAPAAPEVAPLEAPVFNLEAPVYTGVAPSPVEDAPEVKAAKAEFQAAFDEAASRTKRSTPAATKVLEPLKVEPLKVVAPAPLAVAPFGYAGAYAPLAYHGAYAPLAYHGAYAGAYAPYTYAGGYAYTGGLAPYTFPAAAPVDYSVAPAINIPVTPLKEAEE